jgi:uncharacterized protein (UPF0333 family)
MEIMDQKAQISAEFILLIGLILVIVLIFSNIIGEQTELNSLMAAARTGATQATSDMVYLNQSIQPVRVTEMAIIGDQGKTIQIHLSRSLNSYYNGYVLSKTLESIESQGFQINGNNIVTNRHTYNITIY